MLRRTPQVLGVLYAVFAAGVLASCGGSGNTGGTKSDSSLALNPASTDTAVTPPADGDNDDTTPATACTGAPGDSGNSATIIVDKKSPGAVLTLKGAARTYELWIRRKLPQTLSVTMTELDGNVPGVDITTNPNAPGNRWAILTFDISDCPASDDYVVAHQADMKSRAGTLDTIGHRVSGWIQGASGYILAQGIVSGSSSDTTAADSTASRGR